MLLVRFLLCTLIYYRTRYCVYWVKPNQVHLAFSSHCCWFWSDKEFQVKKVYIFKLMPIIWETLNECNTIQIWKPLLESSISYSFGSATNAVQNRRPLLRQLTISITVTTASTRLKVGRPKNDRPSSIDIVVVVVVGFVAYAGLRQVTENRTLVWYTCLQASRTTRLGDNPHKC